LFFAFMIGCGALGQLLGLLVCPFISPWRPSSMRCAGITIFFRIMSAKE
jgi:hypothetical protein